MKASKKEPWALLPGLRCYQYITYLLPCTATFQIFRIFCRWNSGTERRPFFYITPYNTLFIYSINVNLLFNKNTVPSVPSVPLIYKYDFLCLFYMVLWAFVVILRISQVERRRSGSVPFQGFSVPPGPSPEPGCVPLAFRSTASVPPFLGLFLASPPPDYKNLKVSVYNFCIIEKFCLPYPFTISGKSPPRASHGLLLKRYGAPVRRRSRCCKKRQTTALYFGQDSRLISYRYEGKMQPSRRDSVPEIKRRKRYEG